MPHKRTRMSVTRYDSMKDSERDQQVREYHAQDLTDVEIAERVGIHRVTVGRIRRKLGLPPLMQTGVPRDNIPQRIKDKIREGILRANRKTGFTTGRAAQIRTFIKAAKHGWEYTETRELIDINATEAKILDLAYVHQYISHHQVLFIIRGPNSKRYGGYHYTVIRNLYENGLLIETFVSRLPWSVRYRLKNTFLGAYKVYSVSPTIQKRTGKQIITYKG